MLLNTLLTGLEDRLIVDSLALSRYRESNRWDPDDVVKITMKWPFAPKYLDIYDITMSRVPMEWGRLTHLKACHISMDVLIHIFDSAHNLRYCSLLGVRQAEGHYPMPDSPVTHISIKELDLEYSDGKRSLQVDAELLSSYLTFPSLEILHQPLTSSRAPYIAEAKTANALRAFLDRSRPPLRDFFVHYTDRNMQGCDPRWYRILPSITSIELVVRTPDDGQQMQQYLEQMASHVEPRALPSLRELQIESQNICPESWNSLARIFSDNEDSDSTTESSGARRPLKTVIIRTKTSWDLTKPLMPKAIYTRLRIIQQSGVSLHVFDVDGVDVLGSDVELAFDEFDNE